MNDSAAPETTGLRSFFLAGFECATQRRADGRRLDLTASTGHDVHARADYARLSAHGIRAARDGLRWHLIEQAPGVYDWSSAEPLVKAARESGVQVVWDLCHYGYPDGLDIWSAAFVERFAAFSKAAARFLADQSDEIPYYSPVNEMSYWAWAGGDMKMFNPMARGRGGELKRQLVRATIAAVDAVREVDPRARIGCAEPLIHVYSGSENPRRRAEAENYRLAQYEAHDMLTGAREPELGGSPDKLDIVGCNFYPTNQWPLGEPPIPMGHHDYRPLRHMLAETWERYRRPLYLSEVGAENTARPAWLYYVAQEVEAAIEAGVPVGGVCLYPVLDYPGWDNDRDCDVGLFGVPDADGRRETCKPYAAELEKQRQRFEGVALSPPLLREAS